MNQDDAAQPLVPAQVPGSGGDGPAPAEVTLPNLPWAITEPKDDRTLPPWFRRAVILILILVAASKIVTWGFGQLTSFWYTLFFSFFIGLAMEPVVNYLQRRGIRRGVGTFMVMGGLILSTVAFFAVFGALLADQLAQLISSLPEVLSTVLTWANSRFGTQLDPTTILDELGLGAKDIASIAEKLGVGLLSVLGTAVNWVFSLFTILLFSFYFAADGPHFRRTVASWLPPHRQTDLPHGRRHLHAEGRRLRDLPRAAGDHQRDLPRDRVLPARPAVLATDGPVGRPCLAVHPDDRHLPRRRSAGDHRPRGGRTDQGPDRARRGGRLPADRELLRLASHHTFDSGDPPRCGIRLGDRRCRPLRCHRGIVGDPRRRDGAVGDHGLRASLRAGRGVRRSARGERSPRVDAAMRAADPRYSGIGATPREPIPPAEG